MSTIVKNPAGITDVELRRALEESLAGKKLNRVLLLPPDYTRMYSGAGRNTKTAAERKLFGKRTF